MGKAPKWQKEESAALAESWLAASEDDGSPDVKGTNQEADVFWKSVMARFEAKAPTQPKGTYHERGVKPVTNHWKDFVAGDVKKFNKCLLKDHEEKGRHQNTQRRGGGEAQEQERPP